MAPGLGIHVTPDLGWWFLVLVRTLFLMGSGVLKQQWDEGANTTADHIWIINKALAQLPDSMRN